MTRVSNSSESIGTNYPTATGRLKHVVGMVQTPIKIALMGDSTLDNGYWVESEVAYAEKTHTVTHQTASALTENNSESSYLVANFAVDGATTTDIRRNCFLDKVLAPDLDHPDLSVHQLGSVTHWQPDIVVLSVAGNNYREALAGTLERQLSHLQLLLRITPKEAKAQIAEDFKRVKEGILRDYKQIIDDLIAKNPQLKRIILLSQYYPAITEVTPYFIYTGFSHLARAEGQNKGPFTAMEHTMNELYRDILKYIAEKNMEFAFVDVTSSLNPLGGNHTSQIEPNEHGAKVMGRLIAQAANYQFPEASPKRIVRIYMPDEKKGVQAQLLGNADIDTFQVKKIKQFIRENRYRHFNLLISSSSLSARYENLYHVLMGKQFDNEYTGVFALGLLDANIVSVMASYLWRVALNERIPAALRVSSGVVAAPILASKMVLGLSLMLVLGGPLYGAHQLGKCISRTGGECPDKSTAASLK